MIHSAWKNFSNNLKNCDLENLMQNSTFTQTMFCASYVKEELQYLESKYSEDELNRLVWEPIESMPEGNNIHQLYHLSRFQDFLGENSEQILKNEPIIDFGAGYGSLCVRINRLFSPSGYNIIEIPELQGLQAKYLAANNVLNVQWYDSFQDFLKFKQNKGIFFGLWSLSETPEETRQFILKECDFDYYCLAFGDSFFDLQNRDYFDYFREVRPYLTWKLEKIPFMNNQWYLWGKK